MPTPSLTVLMTVYNGMPYLREAVQSVLQQDTRDFDVHIIDNASMDGGRAWLDEQAERHGQATPRLTVEHLSENIGRTAALKRGLERVQTEVTAILDADDKAAPGRVSSLKAFFRDNPDVDLVCSGITYIDSSGAVLGGESFPARHEELCRLLPACNPFARSACAFRTRAALAAGGYDPLFPHAQDLALWIAMLRQGSRAASLPEPLAFIRTHPGQKSRGLALLLVRAQDTQRLTEAILDIPGLDQAARQLALLRGAKALWRLGHRRSALARAWSAFLEAPFSLLCNPLLWRRVRRERIRSARGW